MKLLSHLLLLGVLWLVQKLQENYWSIKVYSVKFLKILYLRETIEEKRQQKEDEQKIWKKLGRSDSSYNLHQASKGKIGGPGKYSTKQGQVLQTDEEKNLQWSEVWFVHWLYILFWLNTFQLKTAIISWKTRKFCMEIFPDCGRGNVRSTSSHCSQTCRIQHI